MESASKVNSKTKKKQKTINYPTIYWSQTVVHMCFNIIKHDEENISFNIYAACGGGHITKMEIV